MFIFHTEYGPSVEQCPLADGKQLGLGAMGSFLNLKFRKQYLALLVDAKNYLQSKGKRVEFLLTRMLENLLDSCKEN